MSDECIFVAVPTYNGQVSMQTMAGVIAASDTRACSIQCGKSSLLATGFNKLWLSALAKRCDWFAMCHADIGPQPGWADILIREAQQHGASVCSAVVPIKGPDRWVSTALCKVNKTAHYVLTLDDVARLPQTFTEDDVHAVVNQDGILCVNTGLWVARLTEPWVRSVAFNIASWIDWKANPPVARTIPEDWGFSQQLHLLKVKAVATTAVALSHAGEYEWCLGGN